MANPSISFTLNTEQDTPTPVVDLQLPANITPGQQIKITLVVADDLTPPNLSAPISQTITVRQAPAAILSVPAVAAVGQAVTLDASKSTPAANLKQFKWTITETTATPAGPASPVVATPQDAPAVVPAQAATGGAGTGATKGKTKPA